MIIENGNPGAETGGEGKAEADNVKAESRSESDLNTSATVDLVTVSEVSASDAEKPNGVGTDEKSASELKDSCDNNETTEERTLSVIRNEDSVSNSYSTFSRFNRKSRRHSDSGDDSNDSSDDSIPDTRNSFASHSATFRISSSSEAELDSDDDALLESNDDDNDDELVHISSPESVPLLQTVLRLVLP